MSDHPMNYRPDIDGLRAISVLLVIFHHLDLSLFSGGFVGVDVFFVISGFLMTAIISRELTTDEFSFKGFYQRRIHRIAPAFFVTIAFTTVAAWFLLLPHDLERFSGSVLYSVAGLANVYMWREFGGYFAAESSETPLLHLWSLGVEEQFYLLWPLFLLILWRFSAARWRPVLMLALTALAAILSEWWTAASTQGGSAYYLLPPRAQELLLGALAFYFVTPASRLPAALAGALRLIALTSIIVAGTLYTEATSFPGIPALLPCGATAILLMLMPAKNDISAMLLRQPFMIYLGKISYPLYLWHWPLVAFLNYWLVDIQWPQRLAVLVTTWLLSDLTWRWIERPLRKPGTLSFRQSFFRLLLIPALVTAGIAWTMSLQNGWYSRFSNTDDIREYFAAVNDKTADRRPDCHVPRRHFDTAMNTDRCVLGDAARHQVDGLLVGDSFANHYSGTLNVLAGRQGLRLADYTMNECRPLKAFAINEQCLARNNAIYDDIARSQYRYVVLGGAWALSSEKDLPHNRDMGRLFEDSIASIVESGATPIVLTRNAIVPAARSCDIKRRTTRPDLQCDLPRQSFDAEATFMNDIIAGAKARFPDLQIIDVNAVLCDDSHCHTTVDGVPLYSDDGHINAVGSRLIGERLWAAGVQLGRAEE